MGKAIIISDMAFNINIGKVTVSGGDIPEVIEIAGIAIVGKASTIQDYLELSVSYTPSNTTQKGVTWKSSDDTIATVSSSGYITVKKAGTVTITATSTYNKQITDSFTAMCSASQTHIPVTSINVSGDMSGKVGEKIQLSATTLPVNATNKNITWSSSNNSTATVDSSGLVTLRAEGTVTITATSVSETLISSSKEISITAASSGTGSAVDIYNVYISESGRNDTPQLLNMLSEMKDGGLLDKLDGLYYLAGTSLGQAKINILDPQGYSLTNGHSLYEYTIDADGIKSKGTYKGVMLCKDFKMSLRSDFTIGVYASTEAEAEECVTGFNYGDSNEGIYVFPALKNGLNAVMWGGVTVVNNTALSTIDHSGCFLLSYNATSGEGTYITNNADATFNRKANNSPADSTLTELGILAVNNGKSAGPSAWGTTASLKFAFVTNTNALTMPELKSMRTILKKYTNLL